jgi:hypothetical protein
MTSYIRSNTVLLSENPGTLSTDSQLHTLINRVYLEYETDTLLLYLLCCSTGNIQYNCHASITFSAKTKYPNRTIFNFTCETIGFQGGDYEYHT